MEKKEGGRKGSIYVMKAAAVSYLNWIQIQEAYLCVCVLEVETHFRPGTKEDVFPRATEVEVAVLEVEEVVEVEVVEVVGTGGSVHFHPGWRNTRPAPLYELINPDSGAASR